MITHLVLDRQIDSRLSELVRAAPPDLREIANIYLLYPPDEYRYEQDRPIYHFTGVLAHAIIEYLGIAHMSIEIAMHLELVYLLHHLRLDIPWNSSGFLQARPSENFPLNALATFGYHMQALRNQQLHELSKDISADKLLDIDRIINEAWLELTLQRLGVFNGDSREAQRPTRRHALTRLSLLPVYIAQILSPLNDEVEHRLREVSAYTARLRLLSVIERCLRQLGDADDPSQTEHITCSELLDFCIYPLLDREGPPIVGPLTQLIDQLGSITNVNQLMKLIEEANLIESVRREKAELEERFATKVLGDVRFETETFIHLADQL